MLKTAQRDILVVSQGKKQNAQDLKTEVAVLERLLRQVEVVENVAISTEVIDVHRNKKYTKRKDIIKLLLKVQPKGFVFFINKN